MFGSIVLDVAIGLVLIYLLYSLLVTILGEIISSWIGIRAKMLKTAIEIMLLDDPVGTPSSSWIERWWKDFTYQTRLDYKNSLAESFYNYPSIKYLGKKELNKIPSYISKENFADTLFNILREKGTGADDMAKIDFCLKYNTLNINDETKKHITNLCQTAGIDSDAFKINLQKWFTDTMERLTGWYKRRIQIILFSLGLLIAISFNVDSIKIAQLLSKDKDARNQMVQIGTAMAKDTVRYHNFIIANGDTLHTQAVIDSSYAHISKDITDANLILGLGWGFDKLKKDSVYIIDLKSNKTLFNKIKIIDFTYVQPIKADIATLNFRKDALDRIIYNFKKERNAYDINLAENNLELAGTITKDSTEILSNIKLLKKTLSLYNHKIAAQTELTKSTNDSLLKFKTYQNYYYKKIDSLIGDKFTSIDIICKDSSSYLLRGRTNYTISEKAQYFYSALFSDWNSLLGFIITALALSLGAPFWFDLLKKLVSMRGSGVNPDEKKDGRDKMTPPAPPKLGSTGVTTNVFLTPKPVG